MVGYDDLLGAVAAPRRTPALTLLWHREGGGSVPPRPRFSSLVPTPAPGGAPVCEAHPLLGLA